MLIRLQKYLADRGVASRRKCETYMKEGLVSVNKRTVTEMGFKVDTETDVVEFKGVMVLPAERKVYVALNKPVGYVTTADDQFGRPCVLDLVSDVKSRVFPAGRLDYHSEGLLILTNDGDLAYKLTHPSRHVPKKYLVKVSGRFSNKEFKMLQNGVIIDGYVTKKTSVNIIHTYDDHTEFEITLTEGRNRQIRKMCEAVGCDVLSLRRIQIGDLSVEGIEAGKYRHLTDKEVSSLLQ